MAKDQTEVGITGQPVPKPKTAKQQYELEKNRRKKKHLGKNVGGTQYSSDVNPYFNPRSVREEIDTRRAPKELLDRLNSSREGHMAQDGPNRPAYDARQRLLRKAHDRRKKMKEQYDIYDIIFSYLLDEGFASDEKSAQAIAGAMSEEWVQSIVEAREEEGKNPDEKRRIRTARTGNTDLTPAFRGGHPVADYERRGRHRERDERNKDLADLRRGKKKDSSYRSYLP